MTATSGTPDPTPPPPPPAPLAPTGTTQVATTENVRAEPGEALLAFFVRPTTVIPTEEYAAIVMPYKALADHLVRSLPGSAERTVALRKLIESKDAAIRAAYAK